jgi:hypothetical protein
VKIGCEKVKNWFMRKMAVGITPIILIEYPMMMDDD